MTTQEILKAVNEAITRKQTSDDALATLPEVVGRDKRYFIFYSGKNGDKKFDIALWESVKFAKNDALAKLLTNEVCDKICWDNIPVVTSFLTANQLDAVFTLHLANKNASREEAKAAPVIKSATKSQVFERMALIATVLNSMVDSVDATSPAYNVVSKYAKRDGIATVDEVTLPEGVIL